MSTVIATELSPKTCALLMKPLVDQGELADSAAHIFPSAMGGRLKPFGILSSKANSLLNQAVDKTLIDTFGATVLYVMKISRDRGSVRGVKLQEVEDQANVWFYSHDKDVLEPFKADIKVEKLEDNKYAVGFSGSRDQFNRFHAGFQPNETVEELLKDVPTVTQPAKESSLGMQPIVFNVFSRAAMTAAHLFSAHKLQVTSELWQDYIQKPFDPASIPPAPNTAFSPQAVEFDDDYGPMAHRIALWNDPVTQQLLSYVQVFGGIGVLAKLYDNWKREVLESYCVDPLTGRQGSPLFRRPVGAKAYKLGTDAWKADALSMVNRIAQQAVNSGVASESRVVVK